MAISMPIFSVFLIFLWGLVIADSQGSSPVGDSLPCMKKLLPCQPYLKGTLPPPPSCCLPLNRIVAADRQCLCAVFNNTAILKTFNVTQDDASNLAKTCGAKSDHVSLCGNAAALSGSNSTQAAPSSTSTNSSTSAPPKESAATSVYHVGGSLGLAALLSFTFSAF